MALAKKKPFHVREEEAGRKFGVCSSRPQQLYPELLRHARKLNYGLLDKTLSELNKSDEQMIQCFRPTLDMKKIYPLEMYPRDSSVTFVETVTEFEAMMNIIECESELAVDLEGHNNYSLRGMTTLLQVSTHKQDFVICPFKCREGICTKLKGLFQNPKIAKIFHAVDNDSLALRRDFNIVLVGAADTKEAWKMLTGAKNAIGFEHMMKALGLPSDLKEKVDKELAQLADWRIRPLPPALLTYARHDTHALIRAWNRLKSKFLSAGLSIEDVFGATADLVVKLRYKPPKEEDPLTGLKSVKLQSPDERLKFIDLHRWRLQLAKMVDCKPTKVISNQQLAEVVKMNPASSDEMQSLLNKYFPPFLTNYQGIQFFKIYSDGMRDEGFNPKCHNCFLLSHQAWACWKPRDKLAWKHWMSDPANASHKTAQFQRRMRKWQANRALRNAN